jgi:hypothetical protein
MRQGKCENYNHCNLALEDKIINILASSTTPKNKLTVQNPKTQQTIESSYHPR